MASKILPNLIRYIISEVQDDGYEILRTRLVKLLYLCDYYYFQSERKLFTGLDWVRYKFGPYAFELNDVTRRMGLELGEEELDFTYGRGVKYEVYDDVPDPEKWLNSRERIIVNRVIERWGSEDLNTLLDYVYCDTEPMIGVEFYSRLSFQTIKRGLRYVENVSLDLAANDVAEIRGFLDKKQPLSKNPISANFGESKEKKDEPDTPSILGNVVLKNYSSANFIRGRE